MMVVYISIIIAGILGIVSLWAEQITGEKKLSNDTVSTKTVFVKALLAIGIIIASMTAYFDAQDSNQNAENIKKSLYHQQQSYRKLDSLYKADLENGRAIGNINAATAGLLRTLSNAKDTILQAQQSQLGQIGKIGEISAQLHDPLPPSLFVQLSFKIKANSFLRRVIEQIFSDTLSKGIELINAYKNIESSWTPRPGPTRVEFISFPVNNAIVTYWGVLDIKSSIDWGDGQDITGSTIVYDPVSKYVDCRINMKLFLSRNSLATNTLESLIQSDFRLTISGDWLEFSNSVELEMNMKTGGQYFWLEQFYDEKRHAFIGNFNNPHIIPVGQPKRKEGKWW